MPARPMMTLLSPVMATGGAALVVSPASAISPAAVGDMTGDGVPDIVESLRCDEVIQHLIRVLVNDGSGRFTVGGSLEVSYPTGHEAPALADFDNDGNLDVAFASGMNNGTVAILLGDGAGNLGAPDFYPFSGGLLPEVSVGDVNGDSNPDVVATGRGGKVSLLLGDGSGALAPPRLVVAGRLSTTPRAAVADVNGDGLDDIVAPVPPTSTATAYST